MISLIDRFTGTLVGVACGDALGGPLEEIPKHPCTTKRPVTEMIGGGYLHLLPGQITDDTEMTLCLARSLLDKNEFDPQDIAEKFLEWHLDNPIGEGGTTRDSLEKFRKDAKWYDASNNKKGIESTGNGSIMRCSPLSLFFYDATNKKGNTLMSDKDPSTMFSSLSDAATKQCIITHRHPECIDSSRFMNVLLVSLLHGEDKFSAYKNALSYVLGSSNLYKRFCQIPDVTTYQTTGTVGDTIETSVSCFLVTDSYESAISKAANLGGDSDTIAAITGGMAGTYYGEKAIPDKWKKSLVDRNNELVYDELIDLGKKFNARVR